MFIGALRHHLTEGDDFCEVPAGGIVDIGGLKVWGLEHHWFRSNPGACFVEAVFREEVEVRIFLIPRFKILSANQFVGIVVCGRSVLVMI